MLNFTRNDYIILIGSICLIIIILFIIASSKFKTNIENNIIQASMDTEFGTTYLNIYDKSTSIKCDRLIIVKPFEWIIWAKNGSVYILGDTNYQCPINYTPATIVPHVINDESMSIYNFKSVCLHSVFNDIINNYTLNIIPTKINFDIKLLQSDPSKFTILDILNYLFLNYITIEENLLKNNLIDSNFLNDKSKYRNILKISKKYIIETITSKDIQILRKSLEQKK
uniref:Uncharacterized protein n=1 Tax=Faxonius propinquus nudivirus TaxID=3139431 RepID=A0AAU8GD55_9VIRU